MAPPLSALDRFWKKVKKTDYCWNWDSKDNGQGYSRLWDIDKKKYVRAHRFSYELHKGQIPEEKVLDHLCRNRSCVNPDHLEAVSSDTNAARGIWATKMNCKNGHLFKDKNL